MAHSSHPESIETSSLSAEEAYLLTGQPMDIGNQMQLFLDPSAYADRWDVTYRINEPAKHPANPVLIADQPWEKKVGLPNVIYDADEQTFRMWYAHYDTGRWGTVHNLNQNYKRVTYSVAYAESDDGVRWTKPRFDITPYGGFDKTNIVFTGNIGAQEFHVDPTPDSMRDRGKYMMWYRDSHTDTYSGDTCAVMLAFSDDGIHWREYENNPVYPWALDAEHSPVYDDRRGLWLLYARPTALAANEVRYTVENVRTRISVSASSDLKNWSTPRQVLGPDELDAGQDKNDKGYFFDRMSVAKYGNQFIGFLAYQPRHGAGSGHIELTSSSDGLHWHRSAKREPFIACGAAGSWDAGHTWMVPRVVYVGHWIYLYYVGSSAPWRQRYPGKTSGIGLARIQKDRFAGHYGSVEGGYLLSREVKVTGDRLLVNLSPEMQAWNQQHNGYVKVELFDRTQGPGHKDHIEGFGLDDCDPLAADDSAEVVSWKGNPDLSSLKDKPIYIRFYLKAAYLFGFRFANA